MVSPEKGRVPFLRMYPYIMKEHSIRTVQLSRAL